MKVGPLSRLPDSLASPGGAPSVGALVSCAAALALLGKCQWVTLIDSFIDENCYCFHGNSDSLQGSKSCFLLKRTERTPTFRTSAELGRMHREVRECMCKASSKVHGENPMVQWLGVWTLTPGGWGTRAGSATSGRLLALSVGCPSPPHRALLRIRACGAHACLGG